MDIKQTLSTLKTNVDGVTMTPEVTNSLIQSVQDQCHDMREEFTRNTAEKIQELQQQLQLKDQQQLQLCHIDKVQQTKINDILTRSVQQRGAVQSWKDRLNNISELLDGKELTSKILYNVAQDIEQINNNNNKIVSSIAQFPLLQCSNALELDTVNQT